MVKTSRDFWILGHRSEEVLTCIFFKRRRFAVKIFPICSRASAISFCKITISRTAGVARLVGEEDIFQVGERDAQVNIPTGVFSFSL